MQGRNHAILGAMAGLALAHTLGPALGTTTPELKLLAASACAGAALLPDWDAPRSKVSTFLWPVTSIAAWAIATSSIIITWLTAGDGDGRPKAHRGATHTLLAAIGVTALLCTQILPFVTYTAITVAALALLGGEWFGAMAIVATLASNSDIAALHAQTSWCWPLMTLAGYLSALAGDAATRSGIPFLAPLVKDELGRRWFSSWILPRCLRFTTGGPFEDFALGPILTILLGVEVYYLAFLPATEAARAATGV